MKRIIVLSMFGLFLCLNTVCEAGQYAEYRVKAAFIYHFCRFSEWPEKKFFSSESFQIGVVGEGSFSDALKNVLHGKKVHERQINVVLLDAKTDLNNIHVLILPAILDAKKRAILQKSQALGVMSISDDAQAIAAGVMVELFTVNDKVRFRVNIAESKQQGIQVSPRLLRLAAETIQVVQP